MARLQVIRSGSAGARGRSDVGARVYGVVFIGGCLGGAARLAIDDVIGPGAWSWDIVAINVVGAALLGAILGWFAVHDAPWWIPGCGAGVLGGFTTFSAMAAPHPDAPLAGFVLLIGTLVGATAAASLGWRVSESIALRHRPHLPPLDIELVEAEVEGFDGVESEPLASEGTSS